MDNQHRKIEGYRDFQESTVDQINTIKAAEADIAQLFAQIGQVPGVDQRSLALAKTSLQEGFMWFVRSVAKPKDVFAEAVEQAKSSDGVA